jgi:hypothetical protein
MLGSNVRIWPLTCEEVGQLGYESFAHPVGSDASFMENARLRLEEAEA